MKKPDALFLLWLRGIIFTILATGTVAGYIPWQIMRNNEPDLRLNFFH